jgi:hypothetical protein
MGETGITPLLKLGTRWWWVVNCMPPAVLVLGKNPRSHWIGNWLGCRFVMDVLEKRKIPDPCQDLSPKLSCPCLVSILIMLSQVPLCDFFTVCNCFSVQFVNSWHTRYSSWSTGVDCHIKHSIRPVNLFILYHMASPHASLFFFVLCFMLSVGILLWFVSP